MRAILSALSLFAALPALAEPTHTAAILERLTNANGWRDHVMVAAHRGGGVEAGRSKFPENSRAAVEHAIAIGAEIVELDVQKSADGVYIVFHDGWLDRSSTCSGPLARRTLAELRTCRLVVEGTGRVTGETIPSLAQMLTLTRGRILVNIDNKLEPVELRGMVAVAREAGAEREVLIKAAIWNDKRVAEMRAVLSAVGEGPVFMPIVGDDAVRDVPTLEALAGSFRADAVELINWRGETDRQTEDGGPLFSGRARAAAIRGDWHLWVNTYAIHRQVGGQLAGGRGDELATLAGLPAETFGFWVERGVTIIQTDEPTAAIDWLAANGWRVPYAPSEPETTAGIN